MKDRMKTLWSETSSLPSFPSLESDAETDFLIIGGGIAGILTAYTLSEAGADCIVCEGELIGGGTTCGTTAVISAQHSTLYSSLISSFGESFAKEYLDANLEGLDKYRLLSKKFDFDFEQCPSYIYTLLDNERAKMEHEAKALQRLGFPAVFTDDIPLPLPVKGAVSFPGQAQMHPLKLIGELARGLKIYEHTLIERVSGKEAFFKDKKIKADKIIVTSHFPLINTHGLFFAKLYQKRSYVIVLEGAINAGGTFADNAESGLYFRNWGDCLIIGGGDHRTGKAGKKFNDARRFAKKYFPDAKEKYAWATQDCMSLDGVPYIGAYSRSTPDILVASGFNEWGMTSAMVAAEILASMALGKESRHVKLFDPSRSMLRPQLLSNLGTTLMDFVTPSARRCPHLGCALKWNEQEHSWDCPCHGSRFSESGELLNNPATGSLKKDN